MDLDREAASLDTAPANNNTAIPHPLNHTSFTSPTMPSPPIIPSTGSTTDAIDPTENAHSLSSNGLLPHTMPQTGLFHASPFPGGPPLTGLPAALASTNLDSLIQAQVAALLPGIVEPYARRTCSELSNIIESRLSAVLPGPREEGMPMNDGDNDADDEEEGPGPSGRHGKRPESGVGQLRRGENNEDNSDDDSNSGTGRNKLPVVLNVSGFIVIQLELLKLPCSMINSRLCECSSRAEASWSRRKPAFRPHCYHHAFPKS